MLNLRGLGETARAFLLPTMVFIVGLLAIIAVGLIHPLGLNEAQLGTSQLPTSGLKAVTILLVLKAFSAGCSALTGVEAIANGVPLFREPRTVRAKRTEMLLGVLLGAMLLGLAVLAKRWQIGPRSGQTVLSQIMAMSVGRGWAYYVVSITITIVLALAANTSFGGLPVLASLVARDNYLPHLFTIRGDRQIFANGIVVLALMAGALLVAVRGQHEHPDPSVRHRGVHRLHALANGSRGALATRPARPGGDAAPSSTGSARVITALATVVFLISKFTEGAWVVVIAIPAFIFLFLRIHAYYDRAGKALAIDRTPPKPVPKHTTVIVPVTRVSLLTEHALCEAASLGQDVIAVTVVLRGGDDAARDAERLRRHWRRWDPGVPLKVLHTDYASVVEPILAYIDELHDERPDDQLVVLIPVIRPDKLRYRILHNQMDIVLSRALRSRSDVIVARVTMPIHLAGHHDDPPKASTTPHGPQQSPRATPS